MCRNIKTLYHFDPPVSEEEIRAAAVQYVRKVSGLSRPSKANEEAFEAAVEAITAATSRLLQTLETSSPPRNREIEVERARTRNARRFSKP